jgi:hypothetical protein
MVKSAADLILMLRNVTGRVDSNDPLFTDEIMLGYLNDFLNLESSQDIRLFKNKTWWEFDISPTSPNPMPVDLQQLGFSTIGPPAYVELLLNSNPINEVAVPLLGTIDGTNQIFTLPAIPPVVPGTMIITGTSPTQVLYDDGNGNIIGNGSGTINYFTGLVSVVFNTAPAVASSVTASYTYNSTPNTFVQPNNFSLEVWWFQDPADFYRHWPDRLLFTPQRPTAILYYNNELTFRGPPDTTYHIKIGAYKNEVIINSSGDISADYLFRYAVYGAALDIFMDFGETDKWHEIFPAYTRYRAMVYARTNNQYQNQRPSPEF